MVAGRLADAAEQIEDSCGCCTIFCRSLFALAGCSIGEYYEANVTTALTVTLVFPTTSAARCIAGTESV